MITRRESKEREDEEETRHDYLASHCNEVLMMILRFCKAKDLLNLRCTCQRLSRICYSSEKVWRRLCMEDFNAQLSTRGPFASYYDIYQLLFKSRLVMGAHVYCHYFEKKQFPSIPSWLWCMAALSSAPPVMKFGKKRFIKRCSGHYLQRFSQIPLGQLRRAFNLTNSELHGLFPGRIERGTVYYTFQAVRFSLFRKYNGSLGYCRFILNKCYRARRVVEANFDKIKNKTPIMLSK